MHRASPLHSPLIDTSRLALTLIPIPDWSFARLPTIGAFPILVSSDFISHLKLQVDVTTIERGETQLECELLSNSRRSRSEPLQR
jgi:hypothetical protein